MSNERDLNTTALDDIDLFLLRIGMMPDGAMADEDPETYSQTDIRNRCNGMVVLGLMADLGTDALGRIRHYATTGAGVRAQGGVLQ